MVSTFSALPVEERMFLFVQSAFEPDCAKQNTIGKYKQVLQGLILQVDAEAYQRRLIGVMEQLCAVKYPELQKWFPLLLKQLYDEDIVEEEVFLEWYEEGEEDDDDSETGHRSEYTRRDVTDEMVEALRGEAAKFINWLKEADSEGEDEDSETEEEEDDD